MESKPIDLTESSLEKLVEELIKNRGRIFQKPTHVIYAWNQEEGRYFLKGFTSIERDSANE